MILVIQMKTTQHTDNALDFDYSVIREQTFAQNQPFINENRTSNDQSHLLSNNKTPTKKPNLNIKYKVHQKSDWEVANIMWRTRKVTGKFSHCLNIEDNIGQQNM